MEQNSNGEASSDEDDESVDEAHRRGLVLTLLDDVDDGT